MNPKNILTKEEKQWVRSNTLKVGINPWEPLKIVDFKNKSAKGIELDRLKLIQERFDLNIEYTYDHWNNLLKKFKKHEIDLLIGTYFTKERASYGLFSKPYMKIKEYLFVKEGSGIKGFKDLKNKKVAIIKGYGTIDKIKDRFPSIEIVQTESLNESVGLVLSGEADALFDLQIRVMSFIKDNLIVGLKGIAQNTFNSSPIYYFSNSQKPLLQKILQKGLDSISSDEINHIMAKWIRVEELSAEEKIFDGLGQGEIDYIKNNRIVKMCNNPDWTPIEFIPEDDPSKIEGISIDTIRLIEKKSGLKFVNVPTKSWEESQQFLKEKKCDILPSAIRTEKREEYANFTKPYMDYKLAIITKNDKPFINSIDEIINNARTISRKKGSGLITELGSIYPGVNIVKTEDSLESFKKVSKGEVYCTIATLPVASFYINRYALNNLHIAGYTDMRYKLAIAVRNDKPQLVEILDKILSSITRKEHHEIYDKWANVKINETFDYKYILYALGLVFFVSLLIIYRQQFLKERNMLLESLVDEKTKELQKYNTELEKQKELYDTVFENSLNGILIMDPLTNRFTECNDKALEMLKADSKEKVLNLHPSQISPRFQPDGMPSEEKSNIMNKLVIKNGTQSFEWKHINTEGEEFWVEVSLTHITIGDKSLIYVMWMDIDERKKYEQELESLNQNLEQKIKEKVELNRQNELKLMEQSKMVSLGEMIGNIAHQWRQPLNIISLSASNLNFKKMRGTLEDEQFVKLCESITKNSQYLSQTIDTFRDFIKEEKVLKEVVLQKRVNKVLTIVGPVLKENHIDLINNIDYETPVKMDLITGELDQVLINIINNAKDILREKKVENPWIALDLKKDEDKVVFTIEDNGGGIPDEVMPRIFEPYFTTKHQSQGTGLGLHMSYKIIVESLKGNLYAQNTQNGAKFHIELPLQS